VHLRESSAASLILPLVLSLVLAGLLAGCGGGGDQSGDQSGGGQQGDNAGGKARGKAGGEAAKKKPPAPRLILIGTVRAYKDDKRRLSLRPVSEAQGEKPIGFKVRKNAEITLDGEKAEFSDIQEDQQAQITYIIKNKVNRAIVVHLFTREQPGDDKKEKQPSGEDEKTG
jgi:hypothetical protein